jgi:hypothetical protein
MSRAACGRRRVPLPRSSCVLLQRAVQEFAATGKKIHTIAHPPEKRLAGMWKTMNRMKDMLGSKLISEVGRRNLLSNMMFNSKLPPAVQ